MIDPNSGSGGVTQDEKMFAVIACILGIFSGFVGPLVIYFIKKDESKFVAFYSLQATIMGVVAIVLAWAFGIGVIVNLIFGIIAAMAANKGEWYEIPVVGPFAKKQVGITA